MRCSPGILHADALLIVTDVDAVYADWGTPEQRAIRRATPDALAATEFAAGSMGPKVRAACSFVEETGGLAAIGSISDTAALLRGEAGTTVTLDAAGLEVGALTLADEDGDEGTQRRRPRQPATQNEALVRAHGRRRRRPPRRRPGEPGLSAAEAPSRRASVGPNKFAEAAVEPRWRAFVRQYRDPMQIVLLVAGIGSLYPLKELGTGLVLLFLTLFNAVLGLRQEGKAAEAVAALQKMMIVKARVRRDGELVQIPAEELVPGDVVSIEAGDVVPADGRLLSAATLEVAESALTGESMPVSKGVDAVEAAETPLGDRTDMVYMNTNVTRGSGAFVVTSTGMSTEVGHISHMLQATEDADTPLTVQLKKLTNQILFIAGGAVALSIILNLSRDQSFDTVFTAAIAFAISAIPTGLPAVVTTILSYGTQMLAKANAIMKRLRSTETLGSTSAINSDKTGTLTLNQMTAVELTIPGRRYTISGGGYSTEGTIKHVFGPPEVPLEQFLLPMALCADAVVKDGEPGRRPDRGRARRARGEGRPRCGRDAAGRTHASRSSRSTPRTS